MELNRVRSEQSTTEIYNGECKTPKVSVVMSVYNEEKYLREAIDNTLNQTFKHFEFIIINDGSTDKTKEILKSYKDKRIKIINNEKNLGLAKSLNIGCREARGEYIARMDGHDISLPERLEKEVNFLEQNLSIGLVGTWYMLLDPEDNSPVITIKNPCSDKEIKRVLLQASSCKMCHVSIMFRKKIAEKIGFYRAEFKNVEDYDFFLRFSEKYGMANIPEVLVKIRLTTCSASIGRKAEQSQYFKLAKILADERRKYGKDSLETKSDYEIQEMLSSICKVSWIEKRRSVANTLYGYGSYLFYNTDSKEKAKKWIKQALLSYPFVSLNAWRILAKCYLPTYAIRKIVLAKRIIKNFIRKCLPGVVKIATQDFEIYIDTRDEGVSKDLFLKGIHEETITNIFKETLKEGMTVLDIGSNIGYFTLLAASLVGKNGKIFAFEPDPVNFGLLSKSVSTNRFSNVILVQKAVSDKNGRLNLYLDPINNGGHKIFKWEGSKKCIEVETITLDDFFRNVNEKIDFIKMEIEGAEMKAFQGMLNLIERNNKMIMITEILPKGLRVSGDSPERYIRELKNHNFNLFYIDEQIKRIRSITLVEAIEECNRGGEWHKFDLLCKK